MADRGSEYGHWWCSDCGKDLSVEEFDENGGLCSACFGERPRQVTVSAERLVAYERFRAAYARHQIGLLLGLERTDPRKLFRLRNAVIEAHDDLVTAFPPDDLDDSVEAAARAEETSNG